MNMKVKVFQLRLSNNELDADQKSLNDFLENISVEKISTELIKGSISFWSVVVFYDETPKDQNESNTSLKITFPVDTDLTIEEERIVKKLKEWRYEKARELKISSFMICHNSELITIAKIKPESEEDLINVKGFGEQKISKFGDDIITILNSILKNQDLI